MSSYYMTDSNKKQRSLFIYRYKKWIASTFIFTSLVITTVIMFTNKSQRPIHLYKKDVIIEEPSSEQQFQNDQVRGVSQTASKKPKNMIMMISDGLGPASVTFARMYYQYINDKPYDYPLPIDKIQVGQSRTRSSSNLVTDSAAGATAFSCALKTFNGATGVDPDKRPCGTVLESAKHQRDMLTGLVVTSRVTHATPAAFSAHIGDRDAESAIATQQIGENPLGRSVDLLFGGGYCHFLPNIDKEESCRSDSRNLLDEARHKYNWTTVIYNDKDAFDQLPADISILPAMSLFTPDHMSYEIDRDPDVEPSLTEMTKKALDILYQSTKDSEKGFFLMIEGSRIDMAAHSNDAATHVHEILEYQNTINLVKEYIDNHPDTMMISTSDHETGGLSLAKQISKDYPEYLWYPDVLENVKISTIQLAKMMKEEKELTREYIVDTILEYYLGITDATNGEIDGLLAQNDKDLDELDHYLADMISFRAHLGWSTHGHSGVDVNLYSYGIGSELLIGNHENTYIGEFITKALDLNLTEITVQLNERDPTFHLSRLTNEEKLKYSHQLEHYHH